MPKKPCPAGRTGHPPDCAALDSLSATRAQTPAAHSASAAAPASATALATPTRHNASARSRRQLLLGASAGLALGATGWARAATPSGDDAAAKAMAAGGVVAVIRHALAPGTFDPPEFRLGDCRTQRNLDDTGRAQARRIGQWFKARSLSPQAVRSSPWCRCQDTAELAFNRAEIWPALSSPVPLSAAEREQAQADRRQALASRVAAGTGFEVWVTHQFVIQALAGASVTSGEALVLGLNAAGDVQVLARWTPA